LNEILVEQVENALLDVPPKVIVEGIVNEIGLLEVAELLRTIAVEKGYTLTIVRRG
jgi:hypothetical protein